MLCAQRRWGFYVPPSFGVFSRANPATTDHLSLSIDHIRTTLVKIESTSKSKSRNKNRALRRGGVRFELTTPPQRLWPTLFPREWTRKHETAPLALNACPRNPGSLQGFCLRVPAFRTFWALPLRTRPRCRTGPWSRNRSRCYRWCRSRRRGCPREHEWVRVQVKRAQRAIRVRAVAVRVVRPHRVELAHERGQTNVITIVDAFAATPSRGERRSPTPTGSAELVSDDFQNTSRRGF